MYPHGFHEWAQADRLALALKFYDNGMNFFKPATFNLSSVNGVVGVEFPIQSYLAAALGHIFGRDNISICFRLLTLLINYAGLAALFLLCYRHTRDIIVSLLVPVFFFCSPVFVFYSCNYLPDTAAVSLCFVGFYFFDEFIHWYRFKSLAATIVALTLATLIKTSAGTFLVGVMGVIVLWPGIRKGINHKVQTVLLFFGSVGVLVSYYFYNQYLNSTYHSDLFLSKPYPFGKGEFSEYINHAFKDFWMREYFVLPQYLLLAAIPAAGIPLLSRSRSGKTMLVANALFLAGVVFMALMFGHQFMQHDYYVIAIYFPLFAYILVTSVTAIRQHVDNKTAITSLRSFTVACMLVLFVFADYHIYRRIHLSDDRYYPGWKNSLASNWLKGTGKELDALGISRKEPVAVVGEMAPNLSFVYLDRSGYLLDENAASHLGSFMEERKLKIAVGSAEKLGRVVQKDSTAFRGFNIVKHERMWVLFR
jgi:hypothetical protein